MLLGISEENEMTKEEQLGVPPMEVMRKLLDENRALVGLLSADAVIPHRAGPDALRLASKLMEAHLGYPPRSETVPHPPSWTREGR